MLDIAAFEIFYFKVMSPFFVFAILTLVWFIRIDNPRLETRNWLKAGPVPLTHHYFEAIAFFAFGWGLRTVGFPLITLPVFMVIIAILTYPLVRRFESKRKTRDSFLLLAATFLAMEVAIVVGFAL